MAPNPNPVPITTQLSPGFVLNSAPVQGAGPGSSASTAQDGEPQASSGAVTTLSTTTGDANPNQMSTMDPSGFTIQTSVPTAAPTSTDPSGYTIQTSTPTNVLVSGMPSTQLSPGMTLQSPPLDNPGPVMATSYPSPSGIVTFHSTTSTVPGLGTSDTSATGTYGSMMTTQLSPGMTLSSDSSIATAGSSTAVSGGTSAIYSGTSVAATDTGMMTTMAGETGVSPTTGETGMSTSAAGAGAAPPIGPSTSTMIVATTPASRSSAAISSPSVVGPNAAAAVGAPLSLMSAIMMVWLATWAVGLTGRLHL